MEPDGEPEKNGVKGCSAEEELVDMAEWEDKVEKVVGSRNARWRGRGRDEGWRALCQRSWSKRMRWRWSRVHDWSNIHLRWVHIVSSWQGSGPFRDLLRIGHHLGCSNCVAQSLVGLLESGLIPIFWKSENESDPNAT